MGAMDRSAGAGAGAGARAQLPLPPHYDAANARRWDYSPDETSLFAHAAVWRRAHDIPPAGAARRDLHLLLIDCQKDFCFPEGSLYVGGRGGAGAMDDSARIAAFIYRNLGAITTITATMDTHVAFQIFSPAFWIDRDGLPPPAHTVVRATDVRAGTYRPNPDMAPWLCDDDYGWLLRQAEFYCVELERAGKYELYLWPPHCILGSEGHVLAGVVHEARLFHSYARGAQSWMETKGGNALTENYSVLRPEVLTRVDGRPLAEKNTAFVERLLRSDAVVVAGQAASHCVKSSVEDLLGEIEARDPRLARKVYLLEDCMSAVTVPDGRGGFVADFTPQAEAALARFRDAGMRVVRSTDPIESWLDGERILP